MLRNFSWLDEGVVAGMARPTSSSNELHELREMGIQAIVSLTETPLLSSLVHELGFEYKHIPIGDFTAPSLEQVQDFVAFVRKMKRANKPTVAHCGAGAGRTGTMLSCYLVSEDRPADKAIADVRRQRPGSVETREQEAVVREYERLHKRSQNRKRRQKKGGKKRKKR